MKKYFVTGLALLLPAVFTILIVSFVINLLTHPFLGTAVSIFTYYDIFNKPFLFFSGPTVLIVTSKILILIALAILIFLVGILGQLFLLKWLGGLGDYLIHRIPFVNKIYKTTQDVVHTIFMPSQNSSNYSRVVLVPFPHPESLSIGFITNDSHRGADEDFEKRISVFVPGTPNPTMGFMLMYRSDQLIPLSMKIEDALKFIVSCGVIQPERL